MGLGRTGHSIHPRDIAQMEQLPFDGFVFHINSSKGGNFVWEMWGDRKFERSEFDHAVENLKATPFKRFTDRFLRVNVTPGSVDWFDDNAWSTVLNNFSVASHVAKEGGCQGFMFDVEQYNEVLFDYRKQVRRDTRGFADYQAQVRERGRQWMHQVNRHFPDITVLLPFGYSITRPRQGEDQSASHYGLLADFLDGMLDSCSVDTRLVDAWEYAYPYKQRQQFRQGYETIRVKSLEWTSHPEKYRRHVTAGFGIWMDYNWRQVGWDLDDLTKNHFSPREFENAVRFALESSDKYVWIYTEQPRWWTNEKLPAAYVSALNAARQSDSKNFKLRATSCEGIYPQHLQGICTNERDAIYWSFTSALVKTDAQGKILNKISVPSHHGDLCFHDGRVYVAVNLGEFNNAAGKADSWVYVYDAEDLKLLGKHETQQVFHGAGGIGFREGHFFIVGGLPENATENYVYEYDQGFGFVKKHVIHSGYTLMGIQTAAYAQGHWWFGCYGNPKILLKCDESLQFLGKYEFDCSLGIVGLPAGGFLVGQGSCQAGIGCRGNVVLAEADDEKALRITSQGD